MVRVVRVLLAVALILGSAHAQWRALGPDGGDARALSVDPRNPDHILLGTTTGQIYASGDGGRSWAPWVHLGAGDDYVLDHIVFDSSSPKVIYVAAWSVQREDGGVFRTRDNGRSWERIDALRGKSIRAFAQSESNPRVLVAAALDGVFRSIDDGENWSRITPRAHPALRNFESLAIDSHDPNVIYAGTWHLPWKTTDGGKTWHSIKQGIVDDSDVFSILLDPAKSHMVFASACSGIYKSEDAGRFFRKVQGIPPSARRTLVLRHDPTDQNVVYAGTTLGLWKSTDTGKRFQSASPSNFIVNDVAIDPRDSQRVLLATDRGGVMISEDGARTFRASNTGFAQRRITGAVVDADGTITVSVLHDREYGGVFRRAADDTSWEQLNHGLGDGEVLDLQRARDGQLLAATTGGVLRWNATRSQWERMTNAVTRTRALYSRVSALSVSGDTWFAATDRGLLRSTNHRDWTAMRLSSEFLSVTQWNQRVAAATARKFYMSSNAGGNWRAVSIPPYVSRIHAIAFANDGTLWVATAEGALKFAHGQWEHVLNGLPAREVRSISITRDRQGEVIVCVADDSDRPFISRDGGEHFTSAEPTGFSLAGAFMAGDRLYAITAFHGLLVKQN
ncbi:MAG TPA: hypothetical protein VMU24_06490 [Candidatus Acidoferrales bacterium]|nr:hypothetical protein [Candidatus Acidoferrales bacterium]